ncbi:hypothetical protein VNI00_008894 [Paramarasmius palmivorus]|uniref:Uncharacterized protein n=1 Tax=Paramarasmius palmivorus TaxID=297713 RepID=A0AAW0CSA8_9AGAR
MSAEDSRTEIVRETEQRIPNLIPGHVLVIITRIERPLMAPTTSTPENGTSTAPATPAVEMAEPVDTSQPAADWDFIPAHPALPTVQSSAQFSNEIPHPRELHPRDL